MRAGLQLNARKGTGLALDDIATGDTMLAVFVAAVASVAARGLSIDCGCFGGGGPVPHGQTAYAAEVVRDLALLAVAAWLVARPQSRLSLGRDR